MPLPGRVIGLHCQRPIAGGCLLAAIEKAGGPDFAADLFQFRQRHTIEVHRLLESDLWQECIDINEALFLHKRVGRFGRRW